MVDFFVSIIFNINSMEPQDLLILSQRRRVLNRFDFKLLFSVVIIA